MPIARFEMPDGKIARFEVPEGTSPEQAQAMIHGEVSSNPNIVKPQTPSDKAVGYLTNIVKNPMQNQIDAVKGVADFGFSAVSNTLAAAGGGLAGIGSGVYSLMQGKGLDKSLQDAANTASGITDSAYQPKTATGKTIATIAGIPIEYASEALSKGGSAVMGTALGIPGGSEMGSSIGGALPQTIGSIAGGGGLLNAAKGASIANGVNALKNVNIPVVSDVASGIRKVALARKGQPGYEQLAKEGLQQMVQTPEEAAKIALALDRRGAPIVPDSPVTSADAIARANREQALKGNPERFGGQYVSLQEDLSKVPETSSTLTTLKLQQEQARANLVKGGSGTEQQYSMAEGIRKGAADATYTPYGKTLLEGNRTLSSLMETPAMKTAIGVAEKIAANEQVPFKLGKDIAERSIPSVSGAPETIVPAQYAQYPLSNLQHVKMALDKMIQNPKDFGIEAVDRGAAIKVRGKLIDWMQNKSPAYEAANTQYAIDSLPLNQMDLWRMLGNKLVSPTGKETPGNLFRTLQDETKAIKEATGMRNIQGFDKIFDTKQSALASRLSAEMDMELLKNKMASEVNVPGSSKMGQKLEPTLPNFLWKPATVASFLLRHLAKDANVGINIAAAKILADPKMLSGVLKQVKAPYRPEILKSIRSAAINKDTAALTYSNANASGMQNEPKTQP